MAIGEQIKALRIKAGLTQQELGEKCGMADSAIRRLESGRTNPTLTTIQRIASALGVTVEFLLGEERLAPDDLIGMRIAEAMLSGEPTRSSLEDIAKRPQFMPAPWDKAETPKEFIVVPTTEDSEYVRLEELLKNGAATSEELTKWGRMSQVRSIYFREYLAALGQSGTKMLVDASELITSKYATLEKSSLDVITDDDLKLALFGGSGEVTDEMWEEAKFAIEFIKEKHKKRKLTEALPDTPEE